MYIGRFAPSPTGELHFGSLLAALASFLDARSHNGHWLLRIDDIDPPREMLGASQSIINTLTAFGLEWDGDIVFQSTRYARYQQTLEQLKTQHLSYACHCSRKDIFKRTLSNRYDRHCLNNPPSDISKCAWRFKNTMPNFSWTDGLLGEQTIQQDNLIDFVLKRSDALWAYQLAVAVDDAAMGITHIVRGSDLLEEASKQHALIKALDLPEIAFSHIPLAKNCAGQKLSKQSLAPALSKANVNETLFQALQVLGQQPKQHFSKANKKDLLHQAIINWNPQAIPLEYPNPLTLN